MKHRNTYHNHRHRKWERQAHKLTYIHAYNIMDKEWTFLDDIDKMVKNELATHWEPYFKHISEFELNTFEFNFSVFLAINFLSHLHA